MAEDDGDQAADSRTGDSMQDVLTAGAVLLFALGGFVFINPNDASVYPGDGGITWRTLPFGYAGLLALLSGIYLVQSLRKLWIERAQSRPRLAPAPRSAEDHLVLFRRLASIALLLGFTALLRTFGFALLAPLFLFLLFRLYQRGAWAGDLLISVVGGLLLWLLFVPVLKMNLAGSEFDLLTPFLMHSMRTIGF